MYNQSAFASIQLINGSTETLPLLKYGGCIDFRGGMNIRFFIRGAIHLITLNYTFLFMKKSNVIELAFNPAQLYL